VLRIPLFVKAPNQHQGRIDDRNIETIDLLPTIADQLGFEIPWETHGCSAFDPACAERDGKVFVTSLGKRKHFTLDRILDRASLERKLELFGAGVRSAAPPRLGRYGALIGRPVAELVLPGAAARIRARLQPEPFRLAAERPEHFALARITGELLGVPPGPAPHVAIAVDGVVLAVAPALAQAGPGRLFSAMLPERLAPPNADRLELLLVHGAPGAARLRRLATTIGADPIRLQPARAAVDRK
jgi:hypothetical protein